MLYCSVVHMLRYLDVQMYMRSCVYVFKCSGVPMFRCSRYHVLMFSCFHVFMC